MSRKKGQTYSAEQKTKIVLEMLKEEMTTVKAEWAVGKLKSLDLIDRKSLIESKHNQLSVSEQCQLVGMVILPFFNPSKGLFLHSSSIGISLSVTAVIALFEKLTP
jgi:hypothetical protein